MPTKTGRVCVRLRGHLEKSYAAQGIQVAGVDEVGRGCLAGPVYAAAAVLDHARLVKLSAKMRRQIRDSKLLSGAQRQAIIPVIEEIALDTKIGIATVKEINVLGLAPAIHLAARRAIAALSTPFEMLLVDGNRKIKDYIGPQQTIIKGDNLCHAIAAAAIIAKEARDQYMRAQARRYPQYGFEQHVGYGTKLHLDMLTLHGVTPLHRRNFAPVRLHLDQIRQPAATH